jgi:hypothetical protein
MFLLVYGRNTARKGKNKETTTLLGEASYKERKPPLTSSKYLLASSSSKRL